jgi:2-polyprenyl-3-methyl-5-hydroxy-6-metoxy-1,4-benzoquinol methylase
MNHSRQTSLTLAMRRARFGRFLELVESCPKRPVQILDVGGTEEFWEAMGCADSGHNITLLNLEAEPTKHANIVSLAGDARQMPQFADNQFDVVFSNSVIEHLETIESQRQMAAEVRRLATKYFVQTPNYYFPVEPHFMFPGFQFLPRAVQIRLLCTWGLATYPRAKDERQAHEYLDEIRLLTRSEFASLFPDAVILRERFFGLTKSFIAVKR